MTVSHSQLDLKQRLRCCTTSVLWLLLVQLFISGLLCAFGYSSHGSACVVAALLAAVVCFMPAVVALGVVAMTAGTPNSLAGTLLSIGVRSAAPLFAVILLPQVSESLAAAGVLAMVLVNYLVVLAVESLLAVRMVQTLGKVAVRQ